MWCATYYMALIYPKRIIGAALVQVIRHDLWGTQGSHLEGENSLLSSHPFVHFLGLIVGQAQLFRHQMRADGV